VLTALGAKGPAHGGAAIFAEWERRGPRISSAREKSPSRWFQYGSDPSFRRNDVRLLVHGRQPTKMGEGVDSQSELAAPPALNVSGVAG